MLFLGNIGLCLAKMRVCSFLSSSLLGCLNSLNFSQFYYVGVPPHD